MKNLILPSALIIFFALNSRAEDETVIKSKISHVTVYTQGAQIERSATYNVSKGISTVIIEGVSPNIDPNSLQVLATGDIVLLDSKYTIFYPTPDPILNPTNGIPPKILNEINMIQDSLFDLSYEISEIQYKTEVLTSEKRIIENNGTIKGQGKVNDSIPLLQDAINFYHMQMNEINGKLLKLNRQSSILSKKQAGMNARLSELQNYNANNNFKSNPPKPPVHQIKITLSSDASATGRVKLSYLVNSAGWVPMYDLRSSAAANKIDLTYKAHVFQNTGVDWKGVKLSLSTNNPYANKTKPVLTPWYLDYYTYRNDLYNNRDVNTSTNASAPGSITLAEKSSAKKEMEMNDDDYDALSAQNFTKMIEQLISVEYQIDLPYDIKSDNEKNMVLVSTKTLDTEYMYYAIPKLDLAVYMVARITNLGELNLVPGTANLFHDGAYLGKTYIDPTTMDDTLDLSLGKDPNMVMQRTLLKNDSKEKVVGDKIVKTMAYQIEIKNHKSKTIRLIIQDQVPVSRNKEIELEIVELSKGDLNEISGIVEWQSKMKPDESLKLEIKYLVKYDKTQNINLAHY